MSGWLEALLGKIYSSGIAIPLSKGLNFTSGLVAALNQSTKQIDVTFNPTQGNANAIAPLIASVLRGTGLTVDAGKLEPRVRPRRAQIQDHFVAGGTTSGTIGALGWQLLGSGSPTYTKQTSGLLSNRKGRITTSNTIGHRAVLCWGSTEAWNVLQTQEVSILQSYLSITSLTDERVFFGLSSDFAVDPTTATNAIGLAYDSAVSPNWLAVSRVGGVGSPIDTGVAVPVTSNLITMQRASTGAWTLHFNATQIASFAPAAAPAATTSMNIGYRVETLAAASAIADVGYFGLNGDLGAPLSNDDFLEV